MGVKNPSSQASTDIVAQLRSEIVESEKARLDFLKWKIILIAALGAAALGIGKDAGTGAPAVLGFIPLVCAYIDVVCIHNDSRIFVIAHFLRTGGPAQTPPDPLAMAYEELCLKEQSSFSLESFALIGTTVLFSILVIIAAFLPSVITMFRSGTGDYQRPIGGAVQGFLCLASLLGIGVSIMATWHCRYHEKSRKPRRR
jgi:hypothetical protein